MFAAAPPVFFVDQGRFHAGVRRALKPQGWAQLHWCQRGVKQRQAFDLREFFARVAQLVWSKNRSSFPYIDASVLDSSPSPSLARCLFCHIPTEFELTKKDRLALNTARYQRFLEASGQLYEFHRLTFPVHPETYRLRDWGECQRFAAVILERQNEFHQLQRQTFSVDTFSSLNTDINASSTSTSSAAPTSTSTSTTSAIDPRNIWILKPSKGSCGRGITLHSNVAALLADFPAMSEAEGQAPRPGKYFLTGTIAQRYISRPLLIQGRKFDVRSYLYIADAREQLVYYCDGYVRQNAEPYDNALEDLTNRFKHLSNVSVQKKHPDFERIQEEMRWRYDKFQQYLTDHGVAPPDWVERVFRPQMKLMMWFAFKSSLYRQNRCSGFFSMVGADFIIDSELNIFLIEFSKTPAVHKSKTGDFTERFLDMISECVSIQLEISQRQQQGESFAPGTSTHLTLTTPHQWQSCRPH